MAEKINIPIFYACDEGFVKFTVVSIHSLMVNASPDYHYSIYILHTGIAPEVQQKALSLAREGFDIIFTDVSERLHTITDVLPVRDYYSNTTYFRLFIADMFPEYDKVIYIDGGILAYLGQDPGNLDDSKFAEEEEAEAEIKVND